MSRTPADFLCVGAASRQIADPETEQVSAAPETSRATKPAETPPNAPAKSTSMDHHATRVDADRRQLG
jgi:hypothetical protein